MTHETGLLDPQNLLVMGGLVAVLLLILFLKSRLSRPENVREQVKADNPRRDMDSGLPVVRQEKVLAEFKGEVRMFDGAFVPATVRLTDMRVIVFNRIENDVYWTVHHGERLSPLSVMLDDRVGVHAQQVDGAEGFTIAFRSPTMRDRIQENVILNRDTPRRYRGFLDALKKQPQVRMQIDEA